MGDNLYNHSEESPFSWGYDLLDITLMDPIEKLKNQNINPNFKEQKIVHLDGEEREDMKRMLEAIRSEHDKKESGYEHIKQAYLMIILTNVKRIIDKQSKIKKLDSTKKQNIISEVLAFIEENYAEKICFVDIAEKYYLTPNHFRQMFKKETGVPPVDYLNRVRVIKSLQYIQTESMSIADAAAKVGIYDANYFSRMFKKIMGYSPRYFKSIPKDNIETE